VSSQGSAAGTDSNMEKRSPISPVHPHMSPGEVTQDDSSTIRPDHDPTRPIQCPTKYTPELTGTSANDGFIELSPDPERLMMNQPMQTSNTNAETAASQRSYGSILPSSLNSTKGTNGEQQTSSTANRPHVMSWMEYDGGGGGGGGMGPKL